MTKTKKCPAKYCTGSGWVAGTRCPYCSGEIAVPPEDPADDLHNGHNLQKPSTRDNGRSPRGSANTRNAQKRTRTRRSDDSVDSADSVAEEWDSPVPLGASTGPGFPVTTFPDWLAAYVQDAARALQVAVDLPACLSLAAVAAAAGGRVQVEVRPGWREPLNLYLTVVLPPGERKSPAFRAVTAPITAAERALLDKIKPEITEASTKRDIADDQARRAAREAAKDDATDDAQDAAIEAAKMAEAITVPKLPRLLADDATPEALTSLLAEHGRIAVLSDEGDIFEAMAGRYSQRSAPNLAPYLKGWDGGALRVDRKGRPPEYVEHPALTLGLAIQPAVLRALKDQPGFRGRGLLARVLWSLPQSFVGFRDTNPDPINPEVADTYKTTIQGIVATYAEWSDPAVLLLTPGAAEVLHGWSEELEPKMRPDGDLASVRDWAAKLVGTTARFAGLLHVAGRTKGDGWRTPVNTAEAKNAVTLGRYFLDHALVAFQAMGADQTLDLARAVADWVKSRDSFSRRDMYHDHPSKFPKAVDVDPVLAVLEEHGWIRRQPAPDRTGKPGRRPAPTYNVNPQLQEKTQP